MTSRSAKEIYTILQDTFGFSTFRDNQEEIIRAILAGRDVFAVMPTGGGKSLCYQLPAILNEGVCIVISPLISLMKDQVDNARTLGIKAGFINSTLVADDRRKITAAVVRGELDLLYLAPERLALADFSAQLKNAPISMIAVDEAHCISEWGHDFRPDYLQLAHLQEIFPGIPISAFTATATNRVQDDIITRLHLRDPFKVRASFNRPNLFYSVRMRENVLQQLTTAIKAQKGNPGIVYRLSRKDVERTTEYLRERGIRALPYHAGLDAMQRMKNQEAFNRDEIQVIVATVAFGMGIDKSNVRFVLHGDLPKNMESYYQETGRSGRDGEPALCQLFYNRGDMARLGYFIDQLVDARERDISWKKLRQMADFAETPVCRRKQVLAYFDEELPGDNCGGCDICEQGTTEIDATVEAQMLMSAIFRTGQSFGAGQVIDIVTGSRAKKILRLGHDRLKTYGVGSKKPKIYWRRLADSMLHAGLLKTGDNRFPILKITPAGEDVLYGRASYTMHCIKEMAQEVAASRTAVTVNPELFALLRDVRRKIADEDNVPAFVIFSDKSLHEMCGYLPVTESEMLAIHGVGKAKLERYGNRFIEEISEFLATHPEIERKSSPPAAIENPRPRQPVITDTVIRSGTLAARGFSLAEIAGERGLKESTVANHINRYLSQGNELNIDNLVSPEKQKQIEQLFKEHGLEFLKPIIEDMQGAASYDEARIVRGYLNFKALKQQD